MENTQSAPTQTQYNLKDLIKNPNAIMDVLKNPSKFGLDYYKTLSSQNKQYLAFAGAIGLIIYGVLVNRKK